MRKELCMFICISVGKKRTKDEGGRKKRTYYCHSGGRLCSGVNIGSCRVYIRIVYYEGLFFYLLSVSRRPNVRRLRASGTRLVPAVYIRSYSALNSVHVRPDRALNTDAALHRPGARIIKWKTRSILGLSIHFLAVSCPTCPLQTTDERPSEKPALAVRYDENGRRFHSGFLN